MTVRPAASKVESSPDAARRGSYRPDIQGLRAVAVLLVAFNHAHIPYFPGGYVGVDVFFVISGFLITGWLLRRISEDREVPFAAFYAARARRILPAAALTIAATLLASYYYLNYVRAKSVLYDGVWSAFFAANVRFSHLGTNYFATDNPPSPLQHFWTLAVEEQFYVVWPALLGVLLFVLARRRRVGLRQWEIDAAKRHRVSWAVGILIGASLIWCVYDTSRSPTSAYFSSLARAWELGIGALLALEIQRLTRLPPGIRRGLGWIGLACIGVATWRFSGGTAFPGYAAALPVGGAALVLIGGVGQARGGAGAILGRQPLRFIGDISYSFYLWHWPILVLPMEYLGHPLSTIHNVELLAAAFVLSAITYLAYENPIRHSDRLTERSARSLALWPVSVGLVLCAFLVGFVGVQSEEAAIARGLVASPGLAIAPAGGTTHTSTTGGTSHPRPSISQIVAASVSPAWSSKSGDTYPVGRVAAEGYQLGSSCPHFRQGQIDTICRTGAPLAHQTMVMLGDSHMEMWTAPMLNFAAIHHWSLVPLVHDGCTAIDWNDPYGGVCGSWDSWALREIAHLRPRVIVFSMAYATALARSPGEAGDLASAYTRAVEVLRPLAPRLIVLQDAPGLPEDPVDCLLAHAATLGSCTFPVSGALDQLDAQLRQIIESRGSRFLRTRSWFCTTSKCPTVIGGVVAYRDLDHISEPYATALSSPFGRALAAAIGPADQ